MKREKNEKKRKETPNKHQDRVENKRSIKGLELARIKQADF